MALLLQTEPWGCATAILFMKSLICNQLEKP
jgi:hypothetical protein